jgi:hypothetical protein
MKLVDILSKDGTDEQIDQFETRRTYPIMRCGNVLLRVGASFLHAQYLKKLSVQVVDGNPEKGFTPDELKAFVGFIPKPSYLSISGRVEKDARTTEFHLSFNSGLVFPKAHWHSDSESCENRFSRDTRILEEVDGVHEKATYDSFLKMFGLKPRKGKIYGTYVDARLLRRIFQGIDTSKIPEAYRWIEDRGFCPDITYWGNKRWANIFSLINSYHPGERANRFELRLEGVPKNSVHLGLQEEDVERVQEVLEQYRDLKIDRFECSKN